MSQFWNVENTYNKQKSRCEYNGISKWRGLESSLFCCGVFFIFPFFFFLFFPYNELSFSLFFQSFLKTMGMSRITLGRIQIEVYEMLRATLKLWSSACPTCSVILHFTVGERKVAWVKSTLCRIFPQAPCAIKLLLPMLTPVLNMQWLLC